VSVARALDGSYIGLQCDTCSKPAPPSDKILKAHGLNRLGWHCSGGTHICADCPQPAASVGSRA
jgi:hypothetical protein